MVNSKVLILLAGAAMVFMNSCGSRNSEKVLAEHTRRIEAALPIGTPASAVAKYFRTNQVPFSSYSLRDVKELNMVDELRMEIENFNLDDLGGLYTATLPQVGQSSFGPYSLRVYVLIDRENRVSRIHLRTMGVGP